MAPASISGRVARVLCLGALAAAVPGAARADLPGTVSTAGHELGGAVQHLERATATATPPSASREPGVEGGGLAIPWESLPYSSLQQSRWRTPAGPEGPRLLTAGHALNRDVAAAFQRKTLSRSGAELPGVLHALHTGNRFNRRTMYWMFRQPYRARPVNSKSRP